MAYPSDLTDMEWGLIRDEVIYPNGYGNQRVHDHRIVLNAIFYITTTGCQWRYLPQEFPPWQTVYNYYTFLCAKGVWGRILQKLVPLSRSLSGRKGPPTYSLIDSQSVKTTGAAEQRGIDGGKKTKGRKRHIITDTLGHLLHVKVHAANLHDTTVGGKVFEEALALYVSLLGVCGDAGYRKTAAQYVQKIFGKTFEIVERIANTWTVLKKRWVVERTFGWLNGYRRLAKDFEMSIRSAENFIRIAHVRMLLRRVITAYSG